MIDWKLVLFWVAAIGVGVVTWWGLFAWLGPGSAVLVLVLLGLAVSAGEFLDRPAAGAVAHGDRRLLPPEI
jgi:hypothetical protein